MFKVLADFETWHKEIEKTHNLLHDHKFSEVCENDTKCEVEMSKKEYDRCLTEFFDIICDKREKDLLKFAFALNNDIKEMTEDKMVKRARSGDYKWHQDTQEDIEGAQGEVFPKVKQTEVAFQADEFSERPPLKILHFNDVYNIEERNEEPPCGYSRFYTAMRSFDHLKPLILFSGDIFAPSKLSVFFEGDHMLPFLKKAGIHCACVGNHDFDFGDERLGDLINQTDFPWLLTNVKSSKTGKMLSNSKEHVVLEHEGYKIAIIGIAEYQWIETLNTLDTEDIIFEPPIDCAKRYVKIFKEDRDDIDFLIALTHMRTPRDEKLAREVPELDLILGGHDHDTVNFQFNNTLMKKSGTDFREFTMINMSLHDKDHTEFTNLKNVLTDKDDDELPAGVLIKDLSNCPSKSKTLITEFQKIDVNSSYKRDPDLHQEVHNYTDELTAKLDTVIGYTAVDLQGKFTKIRHEETNLSNMLADMINCVNKTDCTIINTGTFRLDSVLRAGPIKVQDVLNLIPMADHFTILKVPGENLHKGLENGFSSYPEFQGKFPSISGIEVAFDPNKPPHHRIDKTDIKIKGEPLDYNKEYIVSVKNFIARGKDGYTPFKGCEALVDPDQGVEMSTLLISDLKMLEERDDSPELDALCKVIGNEEKELSPEIQKEDHIARFIMLKPKLDGRIKNKAESK